MPERDFCAVNLYFKCIVNLILHNLYIHQTFCFFKHAFDVLQALLCHHCFVHKPATIAAKTGGYATAALQK